MPGRERQSRQQYSLPAQEEAFTHLLLSLTSLLLTLTDRPQDHAELPPARTSPRQISGLLQEGLEWDSKHKPPDLAFVLFIFL